MLEVDFASGLALGIKDQRVVHTGVCLAYCRCASAKGDTELITRAFRLHRETDMVVVAQAVEEDVATLLQRKYPVCLLHLALPTHYHCFLLLVVFLPNSVHLAEGEGTIRVLHHSVRHHAACPLRFLLTHIGVVLSAAGGAPSP